MVRKVDITKRGCEAAKQLKEEFGADGIPYVRAYDAEGNFIAEGHDSTPVEMALGLK